MLSTTIILGALSLLLWTYAIYVYIKAQREEGPQEYADNIETVIWTVIVAILTTASTIAGATVLFAIL